MELHAYKINLFNTFDTYNVWIHCLDMIFLLTETEIQFHGHTQDICKSTTLSRLESKEDSNEQSKAAYNYACTFNREIFFVRWSLLMDEHEFGALIILLNWRSSIFKWFHKGMKEHIVQGMYCDIFNSYIWKYPAK